MAETDVDRRYLIDRLALLTGTEVVLDNWAAFSDVLSQATDADDATADLAQPPFSLSTDQAVHVLAVRAASLLPSHRAALHEEILEVRGRLAGMTGRS